MHPEFIEVLDDRAQYLLNPRLIDTLQALRDQLATPITINDWHSGGKFKYSGLRPLRATIGARQSMHKTGNAADLKFSGIAPEKVYFHILNNADKYPYISRMEAVDYTPTWLHIECGYDPREGDIVIFKP